MPCRWSSEAGWLARCGWGIPNNHHALVRMKQRQRATRRDGTCDKGKADTGPVPDIAGALSRRETAATCVGAGARSDSSGSTRAPAAARVVWRGALPHDEGRHCYHRRRRSSILNSISYATGSRPSSTTRGPDRPRGGATSLELVPVVESRGGRPTLHARRLGSCFLITDPFPPRHYARRLMGRRQHSSSKLQHRFPDSRTRGRVQEGPSPLLPCAICSEAPCPGLRTAAAAAAARGSGHHLRRRPEFRLPPWPRCGTRRPNVSKRKESTDRSIIR
jgi:hypothetical protein